MSSEDEPIMLASNITNINLQSLVIIKRFNNSASTLFCIAKLIHVFRKIIQMMHHVISRHHVNMKISPTIYHVYRKIFEHVTESTRLS